MAPRIAFVVLLLAFVVATATAAITTTKEISANHHRAPIWPTT
jgi:hypothetical protein